MNIKYLLLWLIWSFLFNWFVIYHCCLLHIHMFYNCFINFSYFLFIFFIFFYLHFWFFLSLFVVFLYKMQTFNVHKILCHKQIIQRNQWCCYFYNILHNDNSSNVKINKNHDIILFFKLIKHYLLLLKQIEILHFFKAINWSVLILMTLLSVCYWIKIFFSWIMCV